MFAKIEPLPRLRWKKGSHGAANGLGARDSDLFPIAVQGFDLLVWEIDNRSHSVIMQ
jgi:hypothetical protein